MLEDPENSFLVHNVSFVRMCPIKCLACLSGEIALLEYFAFIENSDLQRFLEPLSLNWLKFQCESIWPLHEGNPQLVCPMLYWLSFLSVILNGILTCSSDHHSSEIVSAIVSLFTAMYAMKWKEFFPEKEFKEPPYFDGRSICYPSSEILRDYLAWRQVDCEYFLFYLLFNFAN